MSAKLTKLFALLMVLSMLLGACAPAATQPQAPVAVATEAPAATEAPVVTEAPTAVPTEVPEPTAVPLDFQALFTDLFAGLAEKSWSTVPAAKLNEELADKAPFLLDVREAAELEKDGYIAGAVNIPVREVFKNLDKLPGLDEPVVIYCASGHRGGMVMAALQLMGWTNVRNLGGGLGAWKKANLAVETGKPEAPKAISTPIVENEALFTALDEYFTNLPDGFFSVPAAKLNEELAASPAPFLVDVRSQAELDKDGYIDGSVHIAMDKFMTSLDQLPAEKDAPIVIYCASGHRGGMAMMALRFLGYTNVRNLGGGLGGWKGAQLPVKGGLDWNVVWAEYLKALPAGFGTVKPADLNTEIAEKAPFLLDVREAGELEKDGFIAGAVNIPVREVFKNLDKLPALDQPIVVYCASGHRGGMVMAALQVLGYTNVRNLAGGLGGWLKAELPVETGAPAAPVAGTAAAVDAARLAALDGFFAALPEGFFTIKAADLQAELATDAKPVVIDLRTAEEQANGVIEGAVLVGINDLLSDPAALPAKDAAVVLACQSGHRGGIALLILRMLGWTNVRNLGGGMNAWTAAELPVVK
ncbi:MAG: rhodanese-like domain-containing protein [Chloroflexota bacterium]